MRKVATINGTLTRKTAPKRGKKKQVHITLDEYLVEEALNRGYSLSRLLNKLLKEHLFPEEVEGASKNENWCGGRDLNPGPRRGRPLS